MYCPDCFSKNTRVISTDPKGVFTYRYQRCLNCSTKFTTKETHVIKHYNKRNTKIPDDGVREIRKNLYRLSNEQYAEKFNVEIETIEGIVSYKTRKNIK